jgi:putative ABC transport system substrate-binding protein
MKLLSCFVAAIVLISAPAPREAYAAPEAPPGEIVVVCDQRIAPYRALLEGFTKACDWPVRVIPPEEAARDGLEGRLRERGVRAVLAVGIQARDAVEVLRDLPVLLTMVPQADHWVAARPNRSGIEMALSPRRHLETIRRVFPAARRIGVIFDPRISGDYVREAREAAGALNLALETHEIVRPGEFARHLEELPGRVDVFWMLPDPTALQAENVNALLLASFESRIPIYGFARKYVELGAVAAAHLDPYALGGQAAGMLPCLPAPAAAPGSARWEYARGSQLILNQKVARKMGVVLDPKALEAADDVVR